MRKIWLFMLQYVYFNIFGPTGQDLYGGVISVLIEIPEHTRLDREMLFCLNSFHCMAIEEKTFTKAGRGVTGNVK